MTKNQKFVSLLFFAVFMVGLVLLPFQKVLAGVDFSVSAIDDSGTQSSATYTWGSYNEASRIPTFSTTASSARFEIIADVPDPEYYCKATTSVPSPGLPTAAEPGTCVANFPFFVNEPLLPNTNYDFKFGDSGNSTGTNMYLGAFIRINALPSAIITVDQTPVTGGTWIIQAPARTYSGSSNSVKPRAEGTLYTIGSIVPPSGYTLDSVTNSKAGGSSMTVLPGETPSFTLTYAIIPPPNLTLDVAKSGTGSGTVTSSSNPSQAPQINCGANCSVSYPSGTNVTITATPDGSSTFAGWSNGCTGTGTCIVSMTADATRTATFTGVMSGTLSGSNCTIASGSSSCTTSLSWGITNPETTPTAITATGMTNINVTNTLATPQSGIQSATVPYPSRTFYLYNNTKSLVPTSPNGSGIVVTATCTSGTAWSGTACKSYLVTGSAGANGSITPSSRTVAHGSTTTFTVTPNSGYTASTSGCSGSPTSSQGSAYTYTTGAITANCTVTATFTPITYALTITTTGTGSGTAGPAGTYNSGTVVALTNSPAVGSSFAGWSGNADCTDGSVTMNAAKTCTATFNLNTYTVTPSAGANGTISPSAPQTGNYNTTKSFTVTPNSTYTASVGGTCGGSPGSGTSAFTYTTSPLTANCSVSVTFTSMSGTLLPASSSCTIASGGSSCTSPLLSWQVTNPVGGTSNVTNNGTATPSAPTGNPGSSTFTVPYLASMGGVTSFFLNNNGSQLASATVNTNCIVNTTWNGSICAANALPTVTSPTVSAITTTGATLGANVTSLGSPASITSRGTCWGTTTNPTTNCLAQGGTTIGIYSHARTGMPTNTLIYYRGYAVNPTSGTGYSTSSSFTTSALAMSGTLTPGPTTSCTIASGGSSCTIALTRTVTNPVIPGGSAVTSPTGTPSPSNGDSGTVTFTAPYNASGVNFYLYNNAVLLDQTNVATNCTSGTAWNGSACTAGGSMSGTLTPGPTTSCTIASGGSSCTKLLTWTTTNPVATSAVTSPTGTPSPGNSVNDGSQTFTAPYNASGVNFFLYNNAVLLDQTNVATNCTSGTNWDGSNCAVIPSPDPTANLSANPTSIVPPETSTLTWSSTNATSCVGTNFDTGGATSGSVVVSPVVDTTYTVVCDNGAVQASAQVTVTMGAGAVKKPIFKEN